MAKRVVFRVEGNSDVGHGHFMRCLAMARHLEREFKCMFAMSNPSEMACIELVKWNLPLLRTPSQAQYHPDDPLSEVSWHDDVSFWLKSGDLLVLDGYRFDASFVQAAHGVSARVIQVVDDFRALADVDAAITALPIERERAIMRGLPEATWTGLDGFLVRPEFFEPANAHPDFEWDWFVYVSNAHAMDSYREIAGLFQSRVLALTSSHWASACKDCGWDVLVNPPLGNLIRSMRSCEGAKLPASTIAIEFAIATGRSPEVAAFASNQEQALDLFINQGLWKGDSTVHQATTAPLPMTSPQSKFISWVHGRI